ncbi:SHOCT domain-containing protein (plasmid) [Haladaptatus sp. SPP-AMP-3]|uniref:SHOCT domain-containing protein n=1 Tax=Haladaptatus sp. SPP-AMP-3 TaxID=3121295 RepID=UPI003C2B5C13
MTTADQSGSFIRIVLIVLAIILLIPVVMMLIAFPLMGGWMMGPGYGGGVTPIWGWILMLVPLLILLGGGYLLYRAFTRNDVGTDRALEELRLAYARGDLSEEEFEARRSRLRRDSNDR